MGRMLHLFGWSQMVAAAVVRGEHWNKGIVCAFFSAKLNSAQQNYPVHEIEMLAGVESMLWHQDILQGFRFTWITDHKGLTHLYEQKNLSGRQACWMEKLGEFDFEVCYIPDTENVLADVLSRLWSNEVAGTVRAHSAYMYHDVIDNNTLDTHSVSMPLLVGIEAACTVDEHILESSAVSLHMDHVASGHDRGIDNVLVPGKLEARHSTVPRQWKEGRSSIKAVKKAKPAYNTGLNEEFNQPVYNTGMTEEHTEEQAWNTGMADKTLEMQAKGENPNWQLPHGDLHELKVNSTISEAGHVTSAKSNNAQSAKDMSLLAHLSKECSNIDLPSALCNNYPSDSLFHKILAKPNNFEQ